MTNPAIERWIGELSAFLGIIDRKVVLGTSRVISAFVPLPRSVIRKCFERICVELKKRPPD
jgi:hypothetical protein